ncbi:DUF3618 domain-containing protein [Aureimonas sp. Leaf324]|jgi:hypothetical protein|uniref:DUF3618 domain-containing protein n=1 Tax=Aureimonas sp. Leaf324 TaxID=1736336 RepID=UPI0007008A62|nr:DUF3618 domain-containing protein [Aureimonas sp. Leaf324]KQQ80668.1 hypothetical protein ASF65_10620 [Aureimonas sp. Leaf324]
MSTETDRLAREAEERRSNLDATLESLKGKLSPGQIVDEAMGYLREGQGADMARNLNRQVRDNPLALGLVGAGIAWLMLGQGAKDTTRDAGRRLRDRYDDAFDRDGRDWSPDRWAVDDRDNRFESASSGYEADRTRGVTSGPYPGHGGSSSSGIGSSVSGAASSVGSAASSAAGAVGDAARKAGDTISHAASSASDSASRLSHDARDAAARAREASYRGLSQAGDSAGYYGRRARRTFLDTLQDEPLVLGAVALAVGAAIGAALPSTRTEDEWLGETRDRLRDQALDSGREVLDKAGTVAAKAFDAGSAVADEKGLKPTGEGETIAEKVSSVAEAALGTAKDEARKEGLA